MVKTSARRRPINTLRKMRFADWMIDGIILLLVLITVLPFLNLLALSLSGDRAILLNISRLLPDDITIISYRIIFSAPAVYKSFLLTLFLTAIAVIGHFFITVTAGFALSKKDLPFRNFMLLFVLLTMLFSGGLIPFYLVIDKLDMVDTFWVLAIPGTASGYSIVLMKNFIRQIPASLTEAAEIDGASPFRIMFQIIVPLSLPIIATLSLFCGVGKWNDWFTAYIFIKNNRNLLPIQNILQNFVNASATGDIGGLISIPGGSTMSFQYALTIFSMIPIIAAYPFVQRFFVKGIYMGSVKE